MVPLAPRREPRRSSARSAKCPAVALTHPMETKCVKELPLALQVPYEVACATMAVRDHMASS